MSLKAVAYAIDVDEGLDGKPISRTQKLVLLVGANYINDELGWGWASEKTFATKTLLSVRHLRREWGNLERKGLMEFNRGNGRGSATRFRLPALVSKLNTATMSCLSSSKGGQNTRKGGHFDAERGTKCAPKEEHSGNGINRKLASPPPEDAETRAARKRFMAEMDAVLARKTL